MPEEESLESLRELACLCARDGGRLALEMQAREIGEMQSKSSITDIVTRADQAVEARITKLIQGERPGDTILGEETGTVEGTSGLRWVVDPIDGTVNFYYRYWGWVVSVAVEDIHQNQLAGAVFDPVHDELYDALKGGGIRLNGQAPGPLRRIPPESIDQALVATGFGYRAERRRWQAEILCHVLPKIRDIRRGGAAAMDLCHLAAGRVDAYFEKGLNPWDFSAGMIIAIESGCVVEVVEKSGEEYFLLGARTQAIFDQMQGALKDAGALGNNQ